METLLFKQVAEFVDSSFAQISDTTAPRHLRRTVDWLIYLRPDADEALLISARAHDIERAFRQSDMDLLLKQSNDGFGNKEFLERHQKRGADIICTFLQERGAAANLIHRVNHLVSHHEDGGDDDQNLLKDADTLSFFENNVTHFVEHRAKDVGVDKVRQKFQWMFERITSLPAKEIARPWFTAAMKNLDELK